MSLAVVSGIGPFLTTNTTAAKAQTLSVACVKLTWAAMLIIYTPTVDSLANTIGVPLDASHTLYRALAPPVKRSQRPHLRHIPACHRFILVGMCRGAHA